MSIFCLLEEDFSNAFILMLSGAVEWYNEKEIKWKTRWSTNTDIITIEFQNNSLKQPIVREYRKFDGHELKRELHYKEFKPNGKFSIYLNGKIESQADIKNGLANGRRITYSRDGTIAHVENFKNGFRLT